MEELPKPLPTEIPQPMSVHHNAAAHWSMVLAAIGVPVLAFFMVAGLFLLPESSASGLSDDAADSTSQLATRDQGTKTGGKLTTSATPMVRLTVQDADARQAVCNDGTPAVYYFSQGTDEHAQDWVIHLHGGGHCTDDASCTERARTSPQYTSSANYPATMTADGIFSTAPQDNPDFYNWNHVEIVYCSSDIWSGTADGLVDGQTWHFFGHNIITAVIEDLQNPEIITTGTLAEASRVIFTGSSAGGVGAAINLDRVANMLPKAEVTGLIDSAFTFPVERYSDTNIGAQIDVPLVSDFQGRKYDESCLAANTDPSVCTNLLGAYPYLETPVYVFTYQRDPVLTQNLAGITNVKDPAQRDYLDNVFAPAYMSAVAQIDPVFSPDEANHTAVMSDRFSTTKIDNTSFAQAFGDWYFGRSSVTRYVE